MSRKFSSHSLLVCVFAFSLSGAAFAQSTTTSDEGKKAGEAATQAGKDAGDAAAHGAHAAVKATKKAAKKTKDAVTPNTTSAACNDGTVQTGKTKTTACDDHGGVKKQ